MLHRICFLALFGLTVVCSVATTDAQIVGDTVTAANTFQDNTFTGGEETIFGLGSAEVVDPNAEFDLFAGIYDIDVSDSELTMTFSNNDGVGVDLYPAGTFDRYYYGFNGHTVDSVAITSGATELTNGLTVGLLNPGFELDVADLFGTGIPVPVTFANGGFFVQFGEGTNYQDGTLGESVTFNFTTTAVPEPSSAIILCGIAGLGLIRRRR